MNYVDLESERERIGLHPQDGGAGRSIRDRAMDNGNGSSLDSSLDSPLDDAEWGAELFVVEQGRRVGISELWNRGTAIEYRVNLRSKSISGGRDMGLLPFYDPNVVLAVPARAGKVEIDPTYTEDGEIDKITIRVNFKPLSVYDAASREGKAALGLPEE